MKMRCALERKRHEELLNDPTVEHLHVHPEFKLKSGKKYIPSFRYLASHSKQWVYEECRRPTRQIRTAIARVKLEFKVKNARFEIVAA